jgi:hypothetical protein
MLGRLDAGWPADAGWLVVPRMDSPCVDVAGSGEREPVVALHNKQGRSHRGGKKRHNGRGRCSYDSFESRGDPDKVFDQSPASNRRVVCR